MRCRSWGAGSGARRRTSSEHAFRNALSPVLTLLGLYLPLLVGGAVLVEQVFAWPGMGRAIVNPWSAGSEA